MPLTDCDLSSQGTPVAPPAAVIWLVCHPKFLSGDGQLGKNTQSWPPLGTVFAGVPCHCSWVAQGKGMGAGYPAVGEGQPS